MSDSNIPLELKAEILQFLHNQSVDGRIRAMVLDLVNQALRTKSKQMTNQQKDSLTHEVMKEILIDMLKEYPELSNQN
jgi:hypothetical protein